MKVKYKFGKDRNAEKESEWHRSVFHCLSCGELSIIHSDDYYEDNAGYQFICLNCGFGFMGFEDKPYISMPFNNDFLDKARLAFAE